MAENNYSKDHDSGEISAIDEQFTVLKSAYNQQPFPELFERIADLKALKECVLSNQEALVDAMDKDFCGRSKDDSLLGDVMTVVMGINYSIKNLKKWMKPIKRHVSPLFQPASAKVIYQPLGVIGIIAPWNYPLFLSLGPLTTAIAAGNKAMIKMSEFTPHTNAVLKSMLADTFKQDTVAIFDGGPSVAAHFSTKAFDHLLFTGSTRVGKLVMAAAAKNLTPVTLELGGKSPSIIAPDMPIDTAVGRFILGKSLNAGQTCVAPDYVLCPRDKVASLITAVKKQFNIMYPSLDSNADYSSIINQSQLSRLKAWLEDAESKGASVHKTSEVTVANKMPLTMLTEVSDDMTVMQEEIFGPLLPILPYDRVEDAIQYVNDRPRSLALYLFSFDKSLQDSVLKQTHAGGVCINDAAVHVAMDDLPFGGVGPSGMGQYHGKEGFLTFSKAKSVFSKGKVSFSHLAFPPYGGKLHDLIYKMFIR